MKEFVLFSIFLTSILVQVFNDDSFKMEFVPDLTPDNFNKTVDEAEFTLIMFYAPWCPHCQDAKPEFGKAAKELHELDKTRRLALMNCENPKNSELCSFFKIEGYPTIKLFKKSELYKEYDLEPKSENFIKFLLNPDSPDFGTISEPDHPMANVTLLTSENITEYLKSRAHVMVFFYAPWCSHCMEGKPHFSEASQLLMADTNHKDKELAVINCDAKINADYCGTVKVEGFPTIRYFHYGEMFQEYEDEIKSQPIIEFMKNPPKEKVTPTQYDDDTKEETEADKMENVDYLKGNDEFKTYLNQQPGLKTLVMFYAPWCGHCKSAKPHYSAAAKEIITSHSNLKLTAVNCDEKLNGDLCNSHNIESFPTFKLFISGQYKKDYTGSATSKDDIVKFMQDIDKENLKVEL